MGRFSFAFLLTPNGLSSNMKKLSKIISVCIFLTVGFSLPCQSESLLIVFTPYNPANYIDDQGKPNGFFVEIMREALEKRLGIKMKLAVYPWRRCQDMIANGKADLMMTIPTKERLGYSIVADSPIWIKKYRIYTYKEHPFLERMHKIRSFAELKKEKFTVISYIGNDWSKTELENEGIPVTNAPTVESMYRMLLRKRGDLIVEDPLLVAPILAAIGSTGEIVPTQGVVGESRFYPLIGKKSAFAALVPKIEKVLGEMWADGSMARIMAAYREKPNP
ncbi:MAG: transporter substrate-binding domain-containing protein [Deltaproteobacteria bacterium]|nr:transporter substrate-binding domain-containing protein [Deltaproteobacteria bacterium]